MFISSIAPATSATSNSRHPAAVLNALVRLSALRRADGKFVLPIARLSRLTFRTPHGSTGFSCNLLFAPETDLSKLKGGSTQLSDLCGTNGLHVWCNYTPDMFTPDGKGRVARVAATESAARAVFYDGVWVRAVANWDLPADYGFCLWSIEKILDDNCLSDASPAPTDG